jgi:hypothetical protein
MQGELKITLKIPERSSGQNLPAAIGLAEAVLQEHSNNNPDFEEELARAATAYFGPKSPNRQPQYARAVGSLRG